MSVRKVSAVLLALATLLMAAASAQAADYKTKLTLKITAASPVYDEVYTLSIPDSLTITQSGWNSIGNMTASYGGSNSGFDPAKKLVVTATSTHTSGSNFYLASTTAGVTDTVSYFVATGENDSAATTTFEFSAAGINTEGGTSKPIGVNVENYSSKSAGDYEDEITYTVEVKNATTLADALTDGAVTQVTVAIDGVAVTATLTYNATGNSFSASSSNSKDYPVSASVVNASGGDNKFDVLFENPNHSPFTVTFTPSSNEYDTKGLTGIVLNAVTVNGIDITSQLTQVQS